MQRVHLRINDAATSKPTPVRLRVRSADGGYRAPLGRLPDFATGVNEDVGGNMLLGDKMFCFIDGACEIDLPPGKITIEACKGFEYRPLNQTIDLRPGQLSMRLSIERWTDSRAAGWHAGDVRAHFLAPHAALLEAAAEDLAVVNLLAREWRSPAGQRELSNLLAFSGQDVALQIPGHAVVVNTFNTSPLGSLALLNCHRVVHPLRVERIDWTLADWCAQCHRKGGLVVLPAEAGDGEGLADLILGMIDALEMRDPAGLSQWYDLLNIGLRVPLAGGSGKDANTAVLGSPRTYAHLPEGAAWSYKGWIEAVRDGRTFVSAEPLLFLTVNGGGPGAIIETAAATVRVCAQARSLASFEKLQILHNGNVILETAPANVPHEATIDAEVPAPASGWWAARCTGPAWAHTSPVYVLVAGRPMSADADALHRVRERLQHVETLANELAAQGRFASEKDRQRLLAILEQAHARLKPEA